MDQPGFWTGFLWGIVAAGVVGFLSQRLRLAMRDFSSAYRPQRVVIPTRRTPAQVMRASMFGLLRGLGWFLLGAAAATVAYWMLSAQLG